MATTSFQFNFTTIKQPDEVFLHLINPKNWWVGLFDETIEGNSNAINDIFSFKAGEGVHYSEQKLVEVIPNKRIVWQVLESKLAFLKDQYEWDGTKFGFDIVQDNDKTKITFVHNGLTPESECYDQCSSAWAQYLHQLKESLQSQ